MVKDFKELTPEEASGHHSNYYLLEDWVRDAGDVVKQKHMNANIAEAFLALIRMNDKDSPERNLEKVIYYAQREYDWITKTGKYAYMNEDQADQELLNG